jgi:hypothetical protein
MPQGLIPRKVIKIAWVLIVIDLVTVIIKTP